MDTTNIYFVTCPHCHKKISFDANAISHNPKAWYELYNRRTYCPACSQLIDEHDDKIHFHHILGENIIYVFPKNYPDGHMHFN